MSRPTAAVVVLGVVPGKEALAEGARILNRAEAFGKLRAVLQGFELAFPERIVIGDMRAAVSLGDARISQQQGDRLGGHGRAAVGVKSELVGSDVLLAHR